MKPWEQKFEVDHGILSVERLSTVEILQHLVLLGDERIKLLKDHCCRGEIIFGQNLEENH